ncbi:hypothetical protein IHE45_11G005500 [Dioscorea alata]|uniref:Uncharacterized protein n=1 Tax=Dioscorea alata TaxID=55571 RepID=A0ACB7V4H4_DIOAL|nr:hypothetical protein IHE45_11G005500 [Dioscorea alata]
MENQLLDFVLVPLGLIVMAVYHAWLLHRIIRHPMRTVIGINSVNRRLWVESMMQDQVKNGVLAVQTLRNNIMASTLLASTAIMLSSLIAVLMTSGVTGGSWHAQGDFVLGEQSSSLGISIKFFSILVCFLLAFLLNVQSIRYYSHASILINVPAKTRLSSSEYVSAALNRGSYFWSLGLRAFYFSFPLVLWIFGPIPMAASSFVLVGLLYFLDVSSGWGEDDDGEVFMVGGDC